MSIQKIKPPKVSLNIWRSLYQAAIEFRDLSPWKIFNDTDLFTLKDPISNEVGYCSIMGAMGEFFALGIYRGEKGLVCFDRINSNEFKGREQEVIEINDTLMAEFCYQDDLEKEDLKVMKQLGFKNKGSGLLPMFRSSLPGSFPWFINEDEAHYLTFALRCACDLVHRYANDPSFLRSENPDSYRAYIPVEKQDKKKTWEWKTSWHTPSPPVEQVIQYPLNFATIQGILDKKNKRMGTWEVGSTIFPAQIHDKERPYSPRVNILVDRNSFFILGMNTVEFGENSHHKVCDMLLDTISKHGILPEEIVFSDSTTCSIAKAITNSLDIEASCSQDLPAIEDIKEELLNHFTI